MKISILGAGKMGIAFSKAFLKYDLISAKNLQLIVRNAEKISSAKNEIPDAEVADFESVKNLDADLLIVAVKPQDFLAAAEKIPFAIPKKTLVLSIMAGISIEKIQKSLGHSSVVRAMPNTPALLGVGITGYTAADGISFPQIIMVERLLNSTGRSVYLEDEKLLDGVTALSGSGPAYFYYIVDAMIKAGVEMGIEENISKMLVTQTMLGAHHLINNSEKNLESLIKDVASKGGTTEAALRSFEDNSLKKILKDGMLAAEKRAKELNG